MKKTLVILFILGGFCKINGQILQDYPFKTFLDIENNLFVTGYELNPNTNTKDVFIRRISQSTNTGDSWEKIIPNSAGDDQGMDLKVDEQGNVFVTGYLFDNFSNSNKIIIVSLNSDGTDKWMKFIDLNSDDKGTGIDVSIDANGFATDVFVSGYVSNSATGKDIIVMKFSAETGDSLWQKVYSVPGDQVSTHLLLDAGYAYVVGYTYPEGQSKSDIMIQSYWKEDGDLRDNLVYTQPGSNEIPTGFCVPYRSEDPISKSRSAVSSITDAITPNNAKSSYLTICFDPDENNRLAPKWIRYINSGNNTKYNIPTAITTDVSFDIYVTGYMQNLTKGLSYKPGFDFATVKYEGSTGFPLWGRDQVIFTNYNDTSTTGVDDKATSIKLNSKRDVLIAGTSQGSPNGYSYTVIEQNLNEPVEKFKKSFVPNFMEGLDAPTSNKLEKWATLELTSDGTPIMIVMGWNGTEAHWAAVKFDSLGNEEYTINNDEGNSGDRIAHAIGSEKTEVSIKNYPNPFNPTTNLEYGISELGYVSLKVYDMMGREVVTLVNEKKNAGIHSVKFDGSQLSSGIYYYTLAVNGIRMETKSMVLMK